METSQAGTVKIGDSDFMVEFSSMSSVAEITGKSTVPLDIVLVLDCSGSMREELGSSYLYTPEYDPDTSRGTYFVQPSEGTYYRVSYSRRGGWSYTDGLTGTTHTVIPATGPNDTATNHVVFYARARATKMDALKAAANGFIDQTAEQNADVSQDLQHRIAVVSYSTDANINRNLTYITGADAQALKSTINGLYANGSTGADYAMRDAQTVLSGARANAQKVVIFFTDGEPNHQSGFDASVAKDAIEYAKQMKDVDALIYSVGVFTGSDTGEISTGTSNMNRFMHAMSSNYPSATGYANSGTYGNIGVRNESTLAEGEGYYYAATDAEGLESVFGAIADKVLSQVSSPTHVEQGKDPSNSGYVTFTDQLGDYMQVDGFKAITFARNKYTQVSKTTDGLIDTYVFEGTIEGDAVYPAADLSKLLIKVERSDDLKMGDKVTVQIPAAFIPVVHYTVDIDESGNATTTTTDNARPGRIFFGASIKPEAIQLLASPDADMQSYIDSNKDENGNVQFYANKWNAGSGVATRAVAQSMFTPSASNNFYYFQSDEVLFTDEACTTPATALTFDASATYFYTRDYYEVGESAAQQHVTAIPGDSNTLLSGFAKQNAQGAWYIPAGTPRVTSLHQNYTVAKTANPTGTSPNVLEPEWSDVNAGNITERFAINDLGNNGRLALPLPGTLAVSKTVEAADGFELPEGAEDISWMMQLEVKGGPGAPEFGGATFKTILKDFSTGKIKSEGSVTLGSDGTASFSLKHDEQLCFVGLPAGAIVGVEESWQRNAGWNQTAPINDDGKPMGWTFKTVQSGATAHIDFVNAYSAKPVALSGLDQIHAAKSYNAWDNLPATFKIELRNLDGAPMPEGSLAPGSEGNPNHFSTKTLEFSKSDLPFGSTQQTDAKSFGSITYTKPGTYEYFVAELTPQDPSDLTAQSIDWSEATYRVVVLVEDDGKGALTASSTMEMVDNNEGANIEAPVAQNDLVALFTNKFEADSVSVGAEVVKEYTDHSGTKPLESGMFQFKMKPVKITDGKGNNVAIEEDYANIPMPADVELTDGYYLETNVGSVISFAQSTFTQDNVGYTYTYQIEELIPEGANASNNWTVDGTTYDPSVWTVEVKVETKTESAAVDNLVVVNPTWKKNGEAQAGRPTFVNSYKPEEVTLSADTNTAIHGTKTLNGRAWQEGESFAFTLSAVTEGAPMPVDGDNTADATAGSHEFAFGNITYTKPGNYIYKVTENIPAEPAGGMTYDAHECMVAVTVKDNKGKLEAKVAYSNVGAPNKTDASATDHAAFTNSYTASGTLSTGIQISKTLVGRDMRVGEFEFRIEGIDHEGGATAGEASNKLSDSDREFANESSRLDGVADVMTKLGNVKFDLSDVGKTFDYRVAELITGDDDSAKPGYQREGVTYDHSEFIVSLTPRDNGNGTITVDVDIEQQKDFAGNSVNYSVEKISFNNEYKLAASKPVSVNLSKVLEGRSWNDSDVFSFKLTVKDGAPLPTDSEGKPVDLVSVNKDDVKEVGEGSKAASFGNKFGTFSFDNAGTYTYEVKETAADGSELPNGITYDRRVCTLVFSVSDNGNGGLVATYTTSNSIFINSYSTDNINFNDYINFIVRKQLIGRDLTEGQFDFTLVPADMYSAEKVGLKNTNPVVFHNFAATMVDGVATSDMPTRGSLVLTKEDSGKTVKFTFAEEAGSEAGYTYSADKYTLEVATADKGNGTLTVFWSVKKIDAAGMVTIVDEGTIDSSANDDDATEPKAVVGPFVNSYKASTSADAAAKIAATKTMSGRALKAGEFSFQLKTKPATGAGVVVAKASNAAAAMGQPAKVDFGVLSYTLGDISKATDLNKAIADGYATREVVDNKTVYTLNYQASELVSGLPEGVTQTASVFNVVVKVTDNGNGTLSTEVVYPEGTSVLAFANTYSTGNPVSVAFTGTKKLDTPDGLTGPKIDGKFCFSIASDTPGAPLPANRTVHNDAAGNIAFEPVEFTLDMLANVEPDENNCRSKSFIYTVTESGSLEGVTNDPEATKTFSVTLADKADGMLWVQSDGVNSRDDFFGFTNTYDVTPVHASVTDQISITKKLDGRNLREGEFEFQLLEGSAVVSTANNKADGSVEFAPITYHTPGVHTYTVREVAGTVGGVTYDTASYTVVTTVTDNGKGGLDVKHELASAEGALAALAGEQADSGIVFTNTYKASGTTAQLGISKVLKGRELVEGEFAFELKDAEGKLLQTAKNNAAGAVLFDALSFDKAGEYTYTISEMAGKLEHVTYTDEVLEVVVTVTDNGEGNLVASVSYPNGAVLTNIYEAPKPEEPEPEDPKPQEPGKPKPEESGADLPKTGDNSMFAIVGLGIAGIAVVAAGIILAKRRKH